MDWKKIQRVRQAIESGYYTHPKFLEAAIEARIDRFYNLLVDDTKTCGLTNEDLLGIRSLYNKVNSLEFAHDVALTT
jgi:hypothetical protein